MKKFSIWLNMTLLVLCLAACSSATGGISNTSLQPAVTIGATGGQLVADNTTFQQTSLLFPVDTPVSLAFVNHDSVPHNLAIVDANGNTVFKGDIFSGPGQMTYAIPALKTGGYSFHCDVHPDMTGTLTAR